jgi:hypothetical protein
LDDNRALFESLEKLQQLEQRNFSDAMKDDIKKLMSYRGLNGVTALRKTHGFI